MEILVVGAGFAGAVIAREMAEANLGRITVIDKRNHIAGNAYAPLHPMTGSRYHQYGPHIFHTNNQEVVDYLSRFTQWLPYRHRVRSLLPSGVDAPMPINRDTLNAHYGVELATETDMKAFLGQVRVPIESPENAEEYLYAIYGKELTELYFGQYTRKMWGLDLSDMPISVVARLPVRYGGETGYFKDKYQMMPVDGYVGLIRNMLDHDNIAVRLATDFDKAMEADYRHVFNSMPIDEYFDNEFGPLPYRSIKFEYRFDEAFDHDVPTVNFTDTGKYIRKTAWALYPGCEGVIGEHVTYEEPCSYEDNNFERYYPLKTIDGWPQRRYKQYQGIGQ